MMQELKRPLRVAHRGGAGLAPENTLAAFELGLAHQADMLELDLHMSRDGALMVMHDPDLKGATGVTGEIGDLTLAELRRLNAAATYRDQSVASQSIPTLAEVLELARGRAGVQIEIKLRSDRSRYAGVEAQVVDVVRQFDMIDDVMVISFDFATLKAITALEPGLRTCGLISTLPASRLARQRERAAAQHLVAEGVRCIGAKYTLMSSPLFEALRDQECKVGVWTVNEVSDMQRFVEMGVDFITSDRPDLLLEIIPEASGD